MGGENIAVRCDDIQVQICWGSSVSERAWLSCSFYLPACPPFSLFPGLACGCGFLGLGWLEQHIERKYDKYTWNLGGFT